MRFRIVLFHLILTQSAGALENAEIPGESFAAAANFFYLWKTWQVRIIIAMGAKLSAWMFATSIVCIFHVSSKCVLRFSPHGLKEGVNLAVANARSGDPFRAELLRLLQLRFPLPLRSLRTKAGWSLFWKEAMSFEPSKFFFNAVLLSRILFFLLHNSNSRLEIR